MKAVILAGGNGTRLEPLTIGTNKHLLPLYNKPVIHYALEKLLAAGIEDIMVITAPRFLDQFINSCAAFKGNIVFGTQDTPKGIAHGLEVAREFIGTDSCLLWLGDGIIEDDITPHLNNFKNGARIFLKKVADPERFGVAIVDSDLKVREIIEKPENPASDLVVVGAYLYDNSVFDKMFEQPMSDRGEYEITYINNKYIEEGTLEAVMLEKEWFDIGTFESLYEAGTYMRNKEKNAKRP